MLRHITDQLMSLKLQQVTTLYTPWLPGLTLLAMSSPLHRGCPFPGEGDMTPGQSGPISGYIVWVGRLTPHNSTTVSTFIMSCPPPGNNSVGFSAAYSPRGGNTRAKPLTAWPEPVPLLKQWSWLCLLWLFSLSLSLTHAGSKLFVRVQVKGTDVIREVNTRQGSFRLSSPPELLIQLQWAFIGIDWYRDPADLLKARVRERDWERERERWRERERGKDWFLPA